MKIDFTQVMNGLDGNPFLEGGSPVTLSKLCTAAILANYQEDANLSGEEKFQRYLLGEKIYNNPSAELSDEEVGKIKEVVGRIYGPMLLGPVYRALSSRVPLKAVE